jgi:hypothetical protein
MVAAVPVGIFVPLVEMARDSDVVMLISAFCYYIEHRI